MAPITPMWWFKEVPVQLEAFVNIHHTVIHKVPYPRNAQPQQFLADKTFDNQGGVFASPNEYGKSIAWRTKGNASILELISLSSKDNTPTRQIAFQFHAPIIPGIHVGPLNPSGGICIIVMTADGILYRLHISSLSRFVLRDAPEEYVSAAHINWNTREPLQFKYLGNRYAAVASAGGCLHLIHSSLLADDGSRHDHAHAQVFDLFDDSHVIEKIQHVSVFQNIFSRVQSVLDTNLSAPAGSTEIKERLNIVAMETYTTHNDTLLFALYQDRYIRVWSMARRQCIQAMRVPPAANDSGLVQETIDSSLRSHLGIMFNPRMPWALRLLAYIPTENDAQLSVYTAKLNVARDIEFTPGSITTLRQEVAAGSSNNTTNLVSMNIVPNEGQSGYTIWGLWERHMRISARYLQINDPVVEEQQYAQFLDRDLLDGRWWSVAMQVPLSGFIKSMSSIDDTEKDASAFFADYVFNSGRFSDRTVLLALRTMFGDSKTFTLDSHLHQSVVEAFSVKTQEGASQYIKEQNREQEIATWTLFISACAKIDHDASVPLGFSIAPDTGYMIVVKQESLSFLAACDDSEILYHTFEDSQFDAAQLLATPPSQLRSTYPKLQDLALRQDTAKIFRAMALLTRNLNAKSTKILERGIAHLSAVGGPRSFVEVFGQEYLARYIQKSDMNRARNLVTSCRNYSEVFKYIMEQLLLNSDNIPSGFASKRCILPYEALVASGIHQLASNRYAIAQNFLILVTVLSTSAPPCNQWRRDETQFVSDAMHVAQSLLALKWISSQSVGAPLSSTERIEQQLEGMQVQDGSRTELIPLYRKSLTGVLIKSLAPVGHKYGSVEYPLHLAIPRAVSKFLYQLGFLTIDNDSGCKRYHFGFAQRLSELGETDLLANFLEIVPMTSSLSYYKGKVLLSQSKASEAYEQFMALTASFGNDIKDVEQELDIVQLDYKGKVSQGPAKLEDYYTHLIRLFSETNAHEQVIAVAKLALAELSNENRAPPTDKQVSDLLTPIFQSAMVTGAYETAYNAMMKFPNISTRKMHLHTFIKTLSETGNGPKLSLFPFTDLQEEVERVLNKGARQTPVLAHPNYHTILYAYYTYRGDYRNAAATMCQYAMRLSRPSFPLDSINAKWGEIASAYLTAINSLQLAGPNSTWVSVTISDEHQSERSKRRRLSGDLRRHAEFSSSDVSSGPNIVQLTDMKQSYALAQAKQKLRVVADGAVAQNLYVLDARDTSILLVRYGYIDEATSLALLFNQDLDIIFDSLVDKYLTALTTEQEDLTGKDRMSESNWASANKHRSALTLLSLQNYLERYDNAQSSYRYRLEVVERILSRNGDFNLQPWITLHYLSHNPEDLIRLYLKYGAVEKAASFSSQVIQLALKSEELISKHPNARWLPYSLLDETLKTLVEEIKEAKVRLGKKSMATNAGQDHLEKVLAGLEDVHRQLEQDIQAYLENVERESIF
ncbi:hypothetical protein CPC16_001011 [Podila verticillata]|nr:hypothetical protein CPC16_001011 [Podila verticillata]